MRSAGIIMDDIAAVILVGGKSSRMGSDKARLMLRGKRLVDVVAEVARDAGVSAVYVSGEMEGYASLPDLIAECGPVGGICTSAARLYKTHARLLFIPVDMPYANAALLQALTCETQNIACHFEDHPLPCVLPLNRATMRKIDAAAQMLARKKNLSVTSFLTSLGAQTIAVPAHLQKSLTNTNTPREWQEAIHEPAHQ